MRTTRIPLGTSRRRFLKGAATAAVAAAAPTIVPSRVLGADAPSNTVTMGLVGAGGQGNSNLGNFLGMNDVRVLAICDVDKNHTKNTIGRVNQKYSNQDCAGYGDFRELLERQDIDTIILATPDHWHAVVGILAARAGKDIFGEKPFSHDLKEGRALVNAVNQYGRVWQTGSWQRSQQNFHHAAELAINGRVGKIHTVEVGLPTGNPGGASPFIDPPEEMDYNMWVGPSPYAPYSKDRTHWNWRWQLDYGGGQMMDWIGHHGDIAQWGLGTQLTGPVEVEPVSAEWPKEGIWDAPTRYKFVCTYKSGVKMTVSNSGGGIRSGAKWIGDKGWIWVDRSGIDADPKSLLKEIIRPDEIQLIESRNHWRNFIDCVKSRRVTITPAEVAHRSASIGHLGMIALTTGRTIKWNPDTEQILGDENASRLLGRAKREPWNIL